MELQHIFLFIAIASSSLIVAQSFRAPASGPRLAALAVLVASGLGWLIARPIAGYIAAILWCSLLLLPAMLRHRTRARHDPFYRTRSRAITISPVVLALILLNAAVFLIEILFGGPENPLTLYRLGELDTISVLYGHQHWRLFTALFLHYGMVHLAFNMFALLVLGPPLERQIWRNRVRGLLPPLRPRLEHQCGFPGEIAPAAAAGTRRSLGLCYGHRRSMGRISSAQPERASRTAAIAKRHCHCGNANRFRSRD